MSSNITLDLLGSRLKKKPTEHQTSCLLEFSTALRKNSVNHLSVPSQFEGPELSQMIAQRTNQLMRDLRSRQLSHLEEPEVERNRNNMSALGTYSQTTKTSQSRNKSKRKQPTNSAETAAMSKYEQLLKQIIQKQDMLRDVNQRLERRTMELEQLELQYSKKIAASKKEYINLEATLRKESQKLMDIQHRMLQFEQLYEKKKMEISRGKEELQGLLECVEKISRDNEERTKALQQEERSQTEKRMEMVNLQRELQSTREKMIQDRFRLEAAQKDMQNRLAELQVRTDEVARECQRLTQVRGQQYSKEVELVERDKILSAYVSQLNHCIAMLNVQRGGLNQLKTDLANRCQKIFEEMEHRLHDSRNKFTPQNSCVLQPVDPNRSMVLTNEVYRNLSESKPRHQSSVRQPMSINLSSVGSMKFSDTGVLVVDSPTQLLLDTRVLY